MTQSALLAEITASFENEPYPGDDNIVADEAGDNPESLAVRDAFQGHRWQEVPADVLLAMQSSLPAMSIANFRYYLPAFMCAILRSDSPAGSGPDRLVQLLKLPTEVSSTLVAGQIQRLEKADSAQVAELEDFLQQQLTQTNTAINNFIARASQFTKAQGQAIYRFLIYAQDKYDEEPLSTEAGLAIQRYWFQFR